MTPAEIRATLPRMHELVHDPLLAASTAIVTLFVLLMEVGSKCSECVAAYRERTNSRKDQKPTRKTGSGE